MTLDLRDSINLWGPPPSAAEALRAFDPQRLAAYPSPDGGALVPALARFLGVPAEAVIVGCGSDELIDLGFRLAGPGSALACSDPEFTMVPVFAAANGLRVVPLGDPRADVIYLSTPNNPTGGLAPPDTIRALLDRGGLLMLDGAYAEFADGPDWFAEALASDRCLVIRTFSKAWGLAGLRIGYAIGAPPLIDRLRALRSPYSVNAVAEQVAVAALERDTAWMRERSHRVVAHRYRLIQSLRALGAAPLESRANFVLVPTDDAAAITTALTEQGISVRLFRDLPGMGDAIRVGVGPWPMMQAFLDAFAEVRACA